MFSIRNNPPLYPPFKKGEDKEFPPLEKGGQGGFPNGPATFPPGRSPLGRRLGQEIHQSSLLDFPDSLLKGFGKGVKMGLS